MFEVPAAASNRSLTQNIIRLCLSAGMCYFVYKYIDKVFDLADPTRKQKKICEEKANAIFKRLGRKNVKDLKLSEYELNIAAQLIVPEEIPVSWNDIGGLESIIDSIKQTVILPFQKREIFKECKLFSPPKGILLYGPPGCGKTMIAKATAKEAGCAFINVEVQQLTNKWYGESQKLAAAVFSLAYKLQPAIIFIDEIDVFLQMRSDRDHEVTAMMKATFMSLWDGLVSSSNSNIMVMGATNRPHQIDQAILRRMPIRLNVTLPNALQRQRILDLVLQVETLGEDVDLVKLANSLQGFSGSDLQEMCRHASVARVHEHIINSSSSALNEEEDVDQQQSLRPISMNDLIEAAQVMQRSKNSEAPHLFSASFSESPMD